MTQTHIALTVDEEAALNSPSVTKTYLIAQPLPTPFATARVDAPDGLTFPISDIPVKSASVNFTSAVEGMTVFIGSASGACDRGIYFIRKTNGAALLKIGEIGGGDSGQTTQIDRPVTILDDDYVSIYDTYILHAGKSKLSYEYGSTTASISKFTDKAYTDQNTKPEPYFQGDSHKAYRLLDGETSKAVSLSIAAVPFRASQSVSSYAWTVPGSWTGVTGDTTDTVSGDAPEGWHKLKCLVTLNDGTTTTAIRYVAVYKIGGSTLPAVELDRAVTDTQDRNTRKASITLLDDLRSTIRPDLMLMLVDEVTYAGGDVPTLCNLFVGFSPTESGTIEYARRGSTLEIVGIGGILAKLGNDSQRLQYNAAPSQWYQAPGELMTVAFWAWHLPRWHVVNWQALCCYYPISTTIAQQMPVFDASKGNVLSQIQTAVKRIKFASAGVDSTGDLHCAENPSYSGYIGPLRTTITPDMITAVKFTRRNKPDVRLVTVGAFISDGINASAVRAVAPSLTTGQAEGDESPGNILVDSDDTLKALAGNIYEAANKRYTAITLTLPGNWNVFEASHGVPVGYSIDAAYVPEGEALSGTGFPVAVSYRRTESGAAYIELTLEPITSGTEGVLWPYPPKQDSPFGSVGLSGFNLKLPSLPAITAPSKFSPSTAPTGQVKFILLLRNSGSTEWRVARIDKTTGSTVNAAKDISPSSTMRSTLGQPVSLTRDPRASDGYYLLAKNGVAYLKNAAGTPTWTILYTVPYTYTQSGSNWTLTFNFLNSNCGFTNTANASYIGGYDGGEYISGLGWKSSLLQDVGINGNLRTRIGINLTVPATAPIVIGSITVDYYLREGIFDNSVNYFIDGFAVYVGGGIAGGGSFTNPVSGYGAPITISTGIQTGQVAYNQGTLLTNEYHIQRLSLSGTTSGTNPFPSPAEFISDLCVSPGGNVYFLGKETTGGTTYVYCYYTRDNFKTTNRTQVAEYDSTLTYNVAVSPYNPAWVWVSAGKPGSADAKLYFSSNGAVSFTAGATLYTRGGAFRVPRALPGGGQNRLAKNILYVEGVNTNLYATRDGYTHVQISAGGSDYPASGRTLNSFYLDANYALFGLKSRDVYSSNDAGKTWAFVATAPGSGNLLSLEVWPANKNYVLVGGDQCLAYSVDRAANWTNLYTSFATWATATYGASVATVVINALPVLWTVYKASQL